MMDYSEHEKRMMSDCVILALKNCYQAQKLVVDKDVYETIRNHIVELQRLNAKICNSMEKQQDNQTIIQIKRRIIMQRFNINWTVKTLVGQMNKGKVNFDNAVQRGFVWDMQRKSLLIHSMLYGYAIPAMYFTRDSDGIYNSLDGKQRSNAIMEYLSGEFALTEDIPMVLDEDGNLNNFSGMFFEQLPDWAKDRIKDYNLTIYYYEDMTEQEIREFFRRLNNGKPLSSIELTRVSTPDMPKFQNLAKHEAIQNVVTAAGKKRFTDEVIALQLYHMATEESPDFSTKAFREWAQNVKADDETMEDLKAGLNAYQQFVETLTDKKQSKTVRTRTHFVSCVYYCFLACRNGTTQEEINKALTGFFDGDPSVSEEYNKTVTAGSAKPNNVQARQRIMRDLVAAADEAGNDTHTQPETETQMQIDIDAENGDE